jgi:uncharacterized protein
MLTPWGEIAVSDAHVHFFSNAFFQTLSKQKGSDVLSELPALGLEIPDADPTRLAARWVQELDKHDVASAALIASVPGDENSVIAAVQAFPQRFHGFFMLDPMQTDAQSRLIHALDSGIKGVCLFPAMHRYPMHDDRVTAVLQVVSAHPGVAMFVHCGVLSVGIRGKLGLPSHFDMRFSNPLDTHAIAQRFPMTNFVIPHFGAGFFREALMLADLCSNVYFDTSSGNNWVKYQMPAMDMRDAFRRALDLLGPQRIMFGTDSSFFPRGWRKPLLDTQIEVLSDLGVCLEDAGLILGGNLRRILGSA